MSDELDERNLMVGVTRQFLHDPDMKLKPDFPAIWYKGDTTGELPGWHETDDSLRKRRQADSDRAKRQAPTIYLVTSGEYSAYTVDGVFTTRELAQTYIDREGGEIEEKELDPPIPEKPVTVYRVTMTTDGEEHSIFIHDVQPNAAEWIPIIAVAGPSMGHLAGKRVVMFDGIHADHEQHALKIANERRLKLKAEGKL